MRARRVVMLAVMMVCVTGAALGQTEWVDHPDNPVIGPGGPGEWDAAGHYGPSVVFDGTTYHMWFTGTVGNDLFNHVGHATSPDGVDWTMDPANPVLSPGASGEWDGDEVHSGPVIFDGNQFHMWYSGWDGSNQRTGYATSSDGTTWTRHPDNPVLEVGPSGSWDSWYAGAKKVIDVEGTLKMWYTGIASDAAVGYAESTDGVNWVKRTDPVLEADVYPGAWDRPIVYWPEVVFDGSMYHMWYVGGDWATSFLGYAYSSDGIQWTKQRGNPVMRTSDEAFEGGSVLLEGSTWKMWYGHYDGTVDWISYATSECCAGVAGLTHMQTIPAAAVASGAQGSFYQTDVDLNNAGDQPTEYEFMWFPRGETNTDPETSEPFSLGAGMSVRYANVLSEVFGLEPNSFGALSILSSSPDLLAMSRTYNNPGGYFGTFGQAIPAVAPGDFIQTGERRRILFASENEDLRFNVGCQSGGDGSMVVNLELFDHEGTSLETTMMILRAWGNDQLNRVFQDFMPVNGYVDVWTTQANKSFYCYGSVLDNVTSDPTTILPQ